MHSLKYKTSLQNLIDAVEVLPSSIHQQYEERLDRIEQQESEHRNLARRILGWLTHASRPMKVQELRHALAVRQGDNGIASQSLDMEDLFVPCCHGLVSIEQETQIIRLVHRTAQQYLDDNRLAIFPGMQAQILSTCLTYLSFSEFRRGRCSFETFEVCKVNKVANGKRIAKRRFLPNRLLRFPFLHYAASNWGWHATGHVGLLHKSEIMAFLQSPMLLESAAQVQDSDLLYTCSISEESTKSIRANLPLWVSGFFGLDHITSILLTKSESIDVNARYGSKKTALLHKAVEIGSLGLTRVLLDAGADIKLPELKSINQGDRSILYKAIAHGHDAILEALLSQGLDMQVDGSAIYCATFCENEAAVRSIVDHSSDEAERAERLHQILLHAACLDRISIIELALQLGANVSDKDTKGQTALFVAVENGRSNAVDVLLRAGSSTTERDASSKSILQVAVGTHQIIGERLRCIREYGFSYESIPEYSNGPGTLLDPIAPEAWFMEKLDIWLEDCSTRELIKSLKFKEEVVHEDSQHIKVMKKILTCGRDVNEKNSEGQSILHLAVCSTLERARTFIQVSKSSLIIDARDKTGRTALHYAAARGKAAMMNLLLDHGARIDLLDSNKATTLHFSVFSPACTKLTIKRGDLIHTQDHFCRTALHYAALVEEPNFKVRDMLIAAGVRTGTIDLNGRTAQYYYDENEPKNFKYHAAADFIDPTLYAHNPELSDTALYFAIDNSALYGRRYGVRFSRLMKEQESASGEKNKTWTIVSNSDDEDFGEEEKKTWTAASSDSDDEDVDEDVDAEEEMNWRDVSDSGSNPWLLANGVQVFPLV